MVSWNLPARIAGRKAALDLSDSSQQENIQAAPCKKEAPNKGRRAHFNLNKSTVHAHYSLDDLTDEEFDSTWITAQEFMASKQDYVGIVRKMMKTIGPFPETDDCCIRGLGTLIEYLFFSFISLPNTMPNLSPFSPCSCFPGYRIQNQRRRPPPEEDQATSLLCRS